MKNKNSLINKDYEEVLYLLFYRRLPNKKQRAILEQKIKKAYLIDYSYQFNLLKENTKTFDKNPLILAEILLLSLTTQKTNLESKSICHTSLFIQCFIVLINLFNRYVGREIILPKDNLSLMENFLMMIGKDYQNKILLKKISRMLIAWMDCSLVSSSVAARSNISARADYISCIVTGFINCSGKKHTSARIECAKFLLEIKNEIAESSYNNLQDRKVIRKILIDKIQKRLDQNLLVYGFGHYFFKGLKADGYDPRIYIIKDAIRTIYPDSLLLIISEEAERLFENETFIKNGKIFKLPPNSDIFWSSFLLDFFEEYKRTPIELMSLFNILTRMSGIIAHCNEQYAENKPVRIIENS